MKTGMKITLGCLATPFILLLLFGVLVLAFRALPMQTSLAMAGSRLASIRAHRLQSSKLLL